MIPSAFDEENAVIEAPGDINIEPLSVWIGPNNVGIPILVSCWKLTTKELEEINRTGRVWLTVMGVAMPPVYLCVRNPFEE